MRYDFRAAHSTSSGLTGLALSALLFFIFPPAPLVAQGGPDTDHGSGDWRAGTSGELTVLGANVLVGALTGGIGQWRGDGSFLDGFWRGGVGGAGTYVGKRIVAGDSHVPAFVGRGVAAVGASVTRNASDGRPFFDRVILPVGPLRFHLDQDAGTVHTSIDLFVPAAILGTYLSNMGASLDLKRSWSAGAPVFMADAWQGDRGWQGRHIGGVIILREERDDSSYWTTSGRGSREAFIDRTFGHELVHLLQYDQAWILWGERAERGILGRLGASDDFVRRFDFSLLGGAISGVGTFLSHDANPWEIEADILADTLGDRVR